MARNKTKLQEIAARVEAEEGAAEMRGGDAPASDALSTEPQASPMPTVDPAMVDVCMMPVALLGAALCGGYGVTALTSDEKQKIANALALVLAVHNIGIKDPRVASVVMLGAAVANVAAPRILEYQNAKGRAANDIADAKAKEKEPTEDAQAA